MQEEQKIGQGYAAQVAPDPLSGPIAEPIIQVE